MAVVTSLNVLLSAQTTAFEAGFKRAQQTLGGFQRSVVSLRSVGTAVAAIGTAMAGSKIAQWAFEGLKAVDSLNDMARQLGITTAELQGFQHAAEQNGSSAEVMDAALRKMSVNLGEARTGSESAQKALDELGLSSLYLSEVSPAESFMQLSQAIAAIHDPMKRAAAIQQFFGRGAAELGNMLGMTQEEMQAYMVEAHKLSGGLGKEQTDAIQKANDALDKLSRAWQGFKNILAAYVAPWLEIVSLWLTDVLQQLFELVGFDGDVPTPTPKPNAPGADMPQGNQMPGMEKKFTPAANALDAGSQADRLFQFRSDQLRDAMKLPKGPQEKQVALLEKINRGIDALVRQRPVEFTV